MFSAKHHSPHFRHRRFVMMIASAALAICPMVWGQNENRQEDQSASRSSAAGEMTSQDIVIPESGLLKIELNAPTEVRVGESFGYEVRVTNVSSDATLHNVKLAQPAKSGVSIESAQVEQRQNQGSQQTNSGSNDSNEQGSNRSQSNQSADQSGSKSSNSGSSASRSQDSNSTNPENSSNVEESDNNSANNKSDGKSSWTIDSLAPGETRTIRLQAASDNEGESQLCLVVESYETGLCKSIAFVKPELELTKKAPRQASICQPIRYVYTIKNTGSGDYSTLEILDKLAEGLRTETGDKELRFKVDGLEAGEVRKFAANITATQRGDLSSRAVAHVKGKTESRSKKTSTKVVAPELALRIEGSDKGYVDAPTSFVIHVENTGNERAEEAELWFHYPTALEIVDAGELQRAKASGGQSNNNSNASGNGQSPQQANEQNASQQNSDNASSDSKNVLENTETISWNIGSLEPGEARKVEVTLRGEREGRIDVKAVAAFVCASAEERDEALAMAKAYQSMRIVALPALMVSVVDEDGLVTVGNEVIYTITIKNQGQKADSNLELEVTLPDQLEYVDSEGGAKPKVDGQKLTLSPSDKLEPGDRVVWKLIAKANEAGQMTLRTRLTSDYLPDGVISEEPTRVVK